jgi:hypothetical protein
MINQSLQIWKMINMIFLKKYRVGQICPGLGRSGANPAQIQRKGAGRRRIRTCQRAKLVSGPGRPNRYAPFLAVRSSEDRRPPRVVFATED